MLTTRHGECFFIGGGYNRVTPASALDLPSHCNVIILVLKTILLFLTRFIVCQLIRDDLRASTEAEGGDWWRGREEGEVEAKGQQEEGHMDNLEDYVELLYEGKDKVKYTKGLPFLFCRITKSTSLFDEIPLCLMKYLVRHDPL